MKTFVLVVTGKGIPVRGAGSVKAERAEESAVIQFEAENYIKALGNAVMLKKALKLEGNGIVYPCEHGMGHDGLDSYREPTSAKPKTFGKN